MEKKITREDYLLALEEFEKERKAIRQKELKIINDYINSNKKDVLWGEEVLVQSKELHSDIHGFLGGWTVSSNGYVIPLIHKCTVRGTMNKRSIVDTSFLTDYTITVL